MKPFVARLLRDGDPSTRYKLALRRGDAAPWSKEVQRSERVATLLSERRPDGRIPRHPYTKWTGAHWVLVTLADLGYPRGDRSLRPMCDQVLEWLLDKRRLEHKGAKYEPYLGPIQTIRGRVRIHASLEGNALYATLALGLGDDRCNTLADRLIETQWDDGGWNCDRTPSASHSSFEETLIPLRGLIWHARETGSRASTTAARRAAEVLLRRRLFQRRSTGRVISPDFIELHYPCYSHYDVLFALKVLAEGGLIHDKRCEQAIDLVQGRERADGGFPADAKFWSGPHSKSQRSLVRWGPTGKHRSNEFVTADALWVLGRKRAPVE
jgi:hypothetical protein